jgi:hypothetical protein
MNEAVFTCEEHTEKDRIGMWIKVEPSLKVKCDKCPEGHESQATWMLVEASDVVCAV